MTKREPIKPTAGFPLSEAAEELTGYETIALEKKYGKRLDAMGLGEIIVGLVWTFENRNAKVPWDNVGKLTQRELKGYFQPETDDEMGDDDPKP